MFAAGMRCAAVALDLKKASKASCCSIVGRLRPKVHGKALGKLLK